MVFLPGDRPDLNPVERLWDWMRDEVTRGHCHVSLAALRTACPQFIAQINANPETVVDRLWPKFQTRSRVRSETPAFNVNWV